MYTCQLCDAELYSHGVYTLYFINIDIVEICCQYCLKIDLATCKNIYDCIHLQKIMSMCCVLNLIICYFSNVIDVTTVEPHSLEKGEFMERTKQYQ